MSQKEALATADEVDRDRYSSVASRAVVLLAAASYSAVVLLAYLGFTAPRVAGARPFFLLAFLALVGSLVALLRSQHARALAARWAVPLLAFGSGWLFRAAVFT